MMLKPGHSVTLGHVGALHFGIYVADLTERRCNSRTIFAGELDHGKPKDGKWCKTLGEARYTCKNEMEAASYMMGVAM